VLRSEEAADVHAVRPKDVHGMPPLCGHGSGVGHEPDSLAEEGTSPLRLHALEADLNRREGAQDGDEDDGGQGRSASATESASAARTWNTAVLARVGCTRFVRRMTKRRASGSIQREVPVNPVWPKELGDSRLPAEE
jgi:hypothetical protein